MVECIGSHDFCFAFGSGHKVICRRISPCVSCIPVHSINEMKDIRRVL